MFVQTDKRRNQRSRLWRQLDIALNSICFHSARGKRRRHRKWNFNGVLWNVLWCFRSTKRRLIGHFDWAELFLYQRRCLRGAFDSFIRTRVLFILIGCIRNASVGQFFLEISARPWTTFLINQQSMSMHKSNSFSVRDSLSSMLWLSATRGWFCAVQNALEQTKFLSSIFTSKHSCAIKNSPLGSCFFLHSYLDG